MSSLTPYWPRTPLLSPTLTRPDLQVLPTLAPLPETLLITLWARAEESRAADSILSDPAAERLLARITYDFRRFHPGWKTRIGVAVRGRWIDDRVRRFLKRHPGGTILNLGAGLDTRFDRVDNGQALWIDVDLPEVLELRQRLIPVHDRRRTVATDLLRPGWLADIWPDTPSGPVHVVAEGVLMFLPLRRVQALINELVQTLPGADVTFDVIGGVMVRAPWLHDTLPRVGGRVGFAWGVRGPQTVDRWHAEAHVVAWRSLLHDMPRRWRWMRWLRRVPVMHRQFAGIEIRLSPGDD